MSRMNWESEGARTRLGPAAIELLRRMCLPGALIEYERMGGRYIFSLGDVKEQVSARTVDVLARARLIARNKAAAVPQYTASDRGKESCLIQTDQGGAMTEDQIKKIYAETAKARLERAERARAERLAAREQKSVQPTQTEIKAPINVSEGEAAIAEINRIKSGNGGKSPVTILTVSAAESKAREDQIFNVITQTQKENSMSNQNKPELPVTLVAARARQLMKEEHAAGNWNFTIDQAVLRVRAELGLSTDHSKADPGLTAASLAQQ